MLSKVRRVQSLSSKAFSRLQGSESSVLPPPRYLPVTTYSGISNFMASPPSLLLDGDTAPAVDDGQQHGLMASRGPLYADESALVAP